jgi:hypothetical protein
VDWDKLEHELKAEEKGEKLEGEQALQKMFRDIYANADEDMRRAMNKSFQVGKGTLKAMISASCACVEHRVWSTKIVHLARRPTVVQMRTPFNRRVHCHLCMAGPDFSGYAQSHSESAYFTAALRLSKPSVKT